MLRIIAGKYRHLIIEAPETINTRPTTDRVREALMSALGDSITNAIVLDLFSGSGALGLEALSRGAKKTYFCDNAKLAINTIKKNIVSLKIDNAEVIMLDYKAALERLKNENIRFDIVFLDPPYKMKEVYEYVRNYLLDNNMLSTNAILVEESDIELTGDYGKSRFYKYGKIHIKITKELTK